MEGMIFWGKTGMQAALSHAPIDHNGVERFVFYAFPHISISSSGYVGLSLRPGRSIETDVCGALCKLQKELCSGYVSFETDWNDIEQSLLKQRVISQLNLQQEMPSLPTLTHLTYKIILKDLTHLIDVCLQTGLGEGRRVDYAVISGVQVHSPDLSYIWPGEAFAVVDNVHHMLSPWSVLGDIPQGHKLDRESFNDPGH